MVLFITILINILAAGRVETSGAPPHAGSKMLFVYIPNNRIARESLRCHGVAVSGRRGNQPEGAALRGHLIQQGKKGRKDEHPAARFPALRVFGSLNMYPH